MDYTNTAPPLFLTDEEVDEAALAEYRSAGMTKIGKDGAETKDVEAFKDKVYRTVTSRIVNSRPEMAKNSWTQGELTGSVFPNSPGSDPNQLISELSPLEQAVRAKLQRAVWTLTNPDRKGSIQSRLGKEGRTEVLVRTKVQRGVDEIVGVFITNDPKLILEESVQPMVEKLYNVAKEVRLHNDLVIEERHPELMGAVNKILDVAKKRVNAELSRASAQPALPASSAADEG